MMHPNEFFQCLSYELNALKNRLEVIQRRVEVLETKMELKPEPEYMTEQA